MALSNLIAQVLAIVYIVSGLGVLFGKIDFKSIGDEIVGSPTLSFFSGAFGIVIGTVLIHYHNIWTMDWIVVVTLVSWAFLVGGIIIILWPRVFTLVGKLYRQSPLWGIGMIGLGIVFGYFGFYRY
ncbi:MAG: hypothetical protein CVV47_03260 [Spirochaetae bacterium HGW-Spirochaetae-3]|jgi:hypothetical protein|nr:MAG: hypothetical protein CVV47_03260 [Spirochaetae bacterium HGW-Spirochaetae-3]